MDHVSSFVMLWRGKYHSILQPLDAWLKIPQTT